MSSGSKAAFFDSIADKWDGWDDLVSLADRMATGLAAMKMGPDETVLDVGTGTGNLTAALLSRLSAEGRVVAIDISARMLEVARRKIDDTRVRWQLADAASVPLEDAAVDRVFCFSVWPHFDDPSAVADEMVRLLKPGGALHVWHLISRDQVNEIHASAHEAVHRDILAPAPVIAALLSAHGLGVTETKDAETYLVSAMKPCIG